EQARQVEPDRLFVVERREEADEVMLPEEVIEEAGLLRQRGGVPGGGDAHGGRQGRGPGRPPGPAGARGGQLPRGQRRQDPGGARGGGRTGGSATGPSASTPSPRAAPATRPQPRGSRKPVHATWAAASAVTTHRQSRLFIVSRRPR